MPLTRREMTIAFEATISDLFDSFARSGADPEEARLAFLDAIDPDRDDPPPWAREGS